MPVLEEKHDFQHPVEGDSAWSESYYFNCYCPDTDAGFYTRMGIRPNEGTIDVGMSIWVPGGGLAGLHHMREQKVMIDDDLVVGPMTYERLQPLKQWRIHGQGETTNGPIAMDVTRLLATDIVAPLRMTTKSEAQAYHADDPKQGPSIADTHSAAAL